MEPAHVPVKISWARSLTVTVVGLVLGLASFVGLLSQWGQPTTNVATASFVGILLALVILLLYRFIYVLFGGQ